MIFRKIVFPTARLACLLCAAGLLVAGEINPERYMQDVKFLASPELKGRGTGTPGLEKAARYIAKQFASLGLQPAGSKGYLQDFPVTINARLGSRNQFQFTQDSRKEALKANEDFIAFNFSSSGTYSAPLVFAGYGITAREYNYDDYAGVDVKDKFVVVLRHEPQEFDEKSVFSARSYTEHSQFASKAVNAKMHGAKGVILVNDSGAHGGESDTLEAFAKTVGPGNAGIPFVQVKASVVERWLAAAGRNLKDIQAAIDKDLRPQSFAIPQSITVQMSVDICRDVKTVHNVAAYLPGTTDEYVVIGAHYDHLGLGEQFSMAPAMSGTPHLGADDNASGTAGVLELARWFSSQPKQKRGILFLTFAGEELGLLGSSYYVNNPLLPIEKAVAMINLDMIGRIREGKVYIGGAGTGAGLKEILEEVRGRNGSMIFESSDHGGYGSSDHTSFTTKQIPVLFFFSGLHEDYHRPSDTWDKIDAPETAKLLKVVAEVAARLASGDDRPQFVRTSPPGAHGSAGSGGGGGGYGPYFGSIPDFAEVPNGVRFADVSKDSPAEKAGLRGGDILTEFDGKPIQNLYDFTYALRGRKPGDTVRVKVLRNNQPVEADVLLAQRK